MQNYNFIHEIIHFYLHLTIIYLHIIFCQSKFMETNNSGKNGRVMTLMVYLLVVVFIAIDMSDIQF